MVLASNGWSALTALLPFVLLLGFWIFLTRRARGTQIQSPAQQATLEKLDEIKEELVRIRRTLESQ